MLRRLLGLETEYAIGISPRGGMTNPDIFKRIVGSIKGRTETRPGGGGKQTTFLQNGGSVSYESLPDAADDGLVEGATPECRSPRDAVLYQRAQDAWLSTALADAEEQLGDAAPSQLWLRKNCRDAEGHVYGAQENYEADIGRGGWLWAWRIAVLLTLPGVCVAVLLSWTLVVLIVIVVGLVAGAVALISMVRKTYPDLDFEHATAWRPLSIGFVFAWGLAMRPVFAAFSLFGFRSLKRSIVPFLVTRPILTGAGTLEADDRFGLSEKGPSIQHLNRWSTSPSERAIWDSGNLAKACSALMMFQWRPLAALFARRQRFQLGLSDSSVTQVAEYLKVGTTALVLDMAEAGVLADLPRLRHPVRALHAIVADPKLEVHVHWRNETLSALAIQRRYCDRARDFVRRSKTPSLEANEIVELWSRTLDDLERDPRSLVGRVDWVTKLFLLETAGAGEPWDVRKTIDLRFHELGSKGFLMDLERDGVAPRIVTDAEVARAMNEPPQDSPARRRGHLIRDLRDKPNLNVTVFWDRIRIGGPLRGRLIRLLDHPRRRRRT